MRARRMTRTVCAACPAYPVTYRGGLSVVPYGMVADLQSIPSSLGLYSSTCRRAGSERLLPNLHSLAPSGHQAAAAAVAAVAPVAT